MEKTLSAEDLRWRGREDARTLARAEEIKNDKERLANAQKEANNILEEQLQNVKGLSKVASSQKIKKEIGGYSTKKRDTVRKNDCNPIFGFPTTPTM